MLCRKNDCRAIVAFRNRQAGAGVPEPWVNARPCRWGGCDTPKDAHSDAAAREARQAGPGPEPWVAGGLLPSRRLDLLSLVPLAAIVALVALAYGAIYMGYATPVEAITLLFCALAVIGGLAYGRRKPLP